LRARRARGIIRRMRKIKCLVTAGPTREYFDPVRFISNPSTGKMGWNIARAAAEAGWETSLVLGPSQLGDPDGVRVSRVVSALDMLEECERLFDACDMLIMSAAVSDVRPAERLARKASKSRIDLNPRLERTPDILKTLSQKKGGRILVGFAAQTHDVAEYARKKLEEKNLDCIAANSVASAEYGFASDKNKIELIMRSGETVGFAPADKYSLAKKLVEFLGRRFFG
jgi:phosphopantothenoylcysteine synthetase/decarboxylase